MSHRLYDLVSASCERKPFTSYLPGDLVFAVDDRSIYVPAIKVADRTGGDGLLPLEPIRLGGAFHNPGDVLLAQDLSHAGPLAGVALAYSYQAFRPAAVASPDLEAQVGIRLSEHELGAQITARQLARTGWYGSAGDKNVMRVRTLSHNGLMTPLCLDLETFVVQPANPLPHAVWYAEWAMMVDVYTPDAPVEPLFLLLWPGAQLIADPRWSPARRPARLIT